MSKVYGTSSANEYVNKPIKGTVNDTEGNYILTISSEIDKDNNKIIGQILAEDTKNSTYSLFIAVDVDYDFTTETVNSFTTFVQNVSSEKLLYNCKYVNGVLSWTGYLPNIDESTLSDAQKSELAQIKTAFASIRTSFDSKQGDILDTGKDFSLEYAQSYNEIYKRAS